MSESVIESTLVVNNNLFESLSELSPMGILVCDNKNNCVYVNIEFLRFSGYSFTELANQKWQQCIQGENSDAVLSSIDLNQITMTAKNCMLLHKDKRLLDVSVNTVPFYIENQCLGIVRYFEDITLRLKMESNLRVNFAAMESSTSMIMITDKNGIITWVNPAFTKESGYLFAEVIGKNPSFLSTSKNNTINEVLSSVILTGSEGHLEIVNRRKDGSEYLEDQTITPVFDSNGELSHFLSIKKNITVEKENEKKLKDYSERLEELVLQRTSELEKAQEKLLFQSQLENDLKLAAQVQLNLLPTKSPVLTHFDIASRAYAARFISGDIYDFIQYDEDTLYVLMADISGKGIPAALISASARTSIREKILLSKSPKEILKLVNTTLYSDLSKTEMFITMVLIKITLSSGLVVYANAGHTRTMHYVSSSKKVTYFSPTSIPVGIFSDFQSTEKEFYMNPGDILFLYSDGLTEASNEEDCLLGEDALCEVLQKSVLLESENILNSFVETVGNFSHHELIEDDRTLIVIKNVNQNNLFTFNLSKDSFSELIDFVKRNIYFLEHSFISETEILLTELLSNILRHAYGINLEEDFDSSLSIVKIDLKIVGEGFVLDVFDYGKRFNPEEYKEPDPLSLQVGGYGYSIIKRLSNVLQYTREDNALNHWHLEKTKKDCI